MKRSPDREPIPCPRCQGRGEVMVFSYRLNQYEREECFYCNGLEVVHRHKLNGWLDMQLKNSPRRRT